MPTTRSESIDSHEDIDSDDEAGTIDDKGKTSSKRSNSLKEVDSRKQQNRIAQREFRQRKQAYVKNLEAKVALHESSRDEQVEKLTEALRALMDENHKLRALLSNLGEFIGSGLGGCLPSIGLTISDFDALIARGKLETVHELMKSSDKPYGDAERSRGHRPHAPVQTATNGNAEAGPSRSNSDPSAPGAPSGATASLKKRARTMDDSHDVSRVAQFLRTERGRSNSAASFESQPVAQPSTTGENSSSSHRRNVPAPIIPPPAPSDSNLRLSSSRNPLNSYPPLSTGTTSGTATPERRDQWPSFAESSNSTERTNERYMEQAAMVENPETSRLEREVYLQQAHDQLLTAFPKEDTARFANADADLLLERAAKVLDQPSDNPKIQAIQLIAYHMRNKRDNPSYCLPPSLRATTTQQNVPHSPFFDGIIFSSMRDRLILLQGQFDLAELWYDILEHMECHQETDNLLPANWELSETFIRKYWYVIDQEVLNTVNRWRKERGEGILEMKDIVPANKS